MGQSMWLKNKHMKPRHLPPTSLQSHLYVNPTKFEDFEDSYGCKHLMQYVTNVLHVVLLKESKGLRG